MRYLASFALTMLRELHASRVRAKVRLIRLARLRFLAMGPGDLYARHVELDSGLAGILVIAGLAVGGLGLLLAFGANRRVDRMRRSFAVLQGADGEATFVEIVDRNIAEVEMLGAELAATRAELVDVRGDLRAAIRHVAVVRYDAFDDVGGRMSWSAAMLDDEGDGLVLTSIAGRAESRGYAKGVRHGNSVLPLSPEERQVLSAVIGAARKARTA